MSLKHDGRSKKSKTIKCKKCNHRIEITHDNVYKIGGTFVLCDLCDEENKIK